MNTLKITSAALFLGAVFFMAGCQKDSVQTTGATNDVNYDTPDFRMIDLNVLESPEVTDPSETQQFGFKDSTEHDQLPPCMMGLKPGDQKSCGNRPAKPDPKSLAFILHEMKLDSTQRAEVKDFLKGHCDCIAEHMRKVQEMNHEMLRRANEKRMDILHAYKDGKITRAQLIQRLKDLHDALINQLKNNDPKKTEMEIMKRCRDQFFKNVASILNSDQLAMWKRWIQSH